MLHDSQTDLVFLPSAIRLHFPRLYKSLTEALELAHVKYREIPHTQSKTRLWVRDYMPITVDKRGDMAQFRYEPDYLNAARYAKYKPDMVPIWDDLDITPFRYEDIWLDGGNVLADKQGRVYMTDKIFLENSFVSRKRLIAELKIRLNARAIKIVHWDKSDIFGHVDGMMAIADDGSLITDLSWEYLNFLRVGNKIFMAQLGKPSDEAALQRIREAYPDCIVYPIQHVQSLTRLGGGLHCATWNTVDKYYQNAKYFKPSKRHPFNPFTKDAFEPERLRAVVEYYQKRKLSDEEWSAFDDAFYSYWNTLYFCEDRFTFWDMLAAISTHLEEHNSPYFQDKEVLMSICNDLTTYILCVPKIIIPDNSKWSPFDMYLPVVHFCDTDALLTSFHVSFGDKYSSYIEELTFTELVEAEARKAAQRHDGTIYVLYYHDDEKRRVCPYRYIFKVCKNDSYATIIMYWRSPFSDLRITDYARKACSEVKYYDVCVSNLSDAASDLPDAASDLLDMPF